MSRRLPFALAVLLVVASPALGGVGERKHAVDSKIDTLQGRLASQKGREQALRGEVADVTSRIRGLEARVGDVSLRLQTLEQDLALHQDRLDALDSLYRLQTKRYAFLRREYAAAAARRDARLIAIYETQDVTSLDLVLGSRSVQEALDAVEFFNQIGEQDRRVAREVADSKRHVRAARAHTRKLRTSVRSETQVISARASQTQTVRNELVGARDELSISKQSKLVDLSSLTADERAEVGEIDSLQQVSASLGAQIRAAQARAAAAAAAAAAAEAAQAPAAPAGSSSSSGGPGYGAPDGTPSSSGLIFPAAGPITSPYGYRWGRLHEGIDIGAPYGSAVSAAASGTVIYCGWESGYGNLTVIDHGNGLATAYGHQSAIGVGCGQHVSQGDAIGAVGSTGHSTGPHLHFEVRVNGTAVDPLGYL